MSASARMINALHRAHFLLLIHLSMHSDLMSLQAGPIRVGHFCPNCLKSGDDCLSLGAGEAACAGSDSVLAREACAGQKVVCTILLRLK